MSKNVGKISQIMGAVVDVKFEDGKFPCSSNPIPDCSTRLSVDKYILSERDILPIVYSTSIEFVVEI